MTPIIRTDRVSKMFKKGVKAVQKVSLTVNRGEIYGLIGLNGAGKTTLIRMLLGMARPTKGRCFLYGKRVTQTSYSLFKNIGYMIENPKSYPELTVKENLMMIAKLRLVSDVRLINEAIERFKLSNVEQTKVKDLSLGNKQRLGLAKALVHKPDLLILDEPMNGLDPGGILEIRQFLKVLAREKGVTIFLSSHLLSEVAQLATTIGILHKGRLVKEVQRKELLKELKKQLVIKTRNNKKVYKLFKERGFHPKVKKDQIRLQDSKATSQPEQIATLLVNAGIPPKELYIAEETLEDYFLRTIERREK